MEVNWCKREDIEDKETTEIITKASDVCLQNSPSPGRATCIAGPVPHGDSLLQAPIVPVPLSLSPYGSRELPSFLAPLPVAGRADLTRHLLHHNGWELNGSPCVRAPSTKGFIAWF